MNQEVPQRVTKHLLPNRRRRSKKRNKAKKRKRSQSHTILLQDSDIESTGKDTHRQSRKTRSVGAQRHTIRAKRTKKNRHGPQSARKTTLDFATTSSRATTKPPHFRDTQAKKDTASGSKKRSAHRANRFGPVLQQKAQHPPKYKFDPTNAFHTKIVEVAAKGNEDGIELVQTFGNSPLFPMCADKLSLPGIVYFAEIMFALTIVVFNRPRSFCNTIFAKDRFLCAKLKTRILEWLRRFFVQVAVASRENSLSLPATLFQVYLQLTHMQHTFDLPRSLTDPPATRGPQIQRNCETASALHKQQMRTDQVLAASMPCIEDFFKTTRTFNLFCTCNRWDCVFENGHMHRPLITKIFHKQKRRAQKRLRKPVSASTPSSGLNAVGTAFAQGCAGAQVVPASNLSLSFDFKTTCPAGTAFKEHIKLYTMICDRIDILAMKLVVCPTVSVQFRDSWVEDLGALIAAKKQPKPGSHERVVEDEATKYSRAKQARALELSKRNKRTEKDKASSAGWMSKNRMNVVGADEESDEETKMPPEKEDERKHALSFGAKKSSKIRCVLETATRFAFWCRSQLDVVHSRKCKTMAVYNTALQRACGRVMRAFDTSMQIKPDPSLKTSLTKLVYQMAMSTCTREFFLQLNRNQTRKINPITIMNRMLAPDYIRLLQTSFNGRGMGDIYREEKHPFRDMVILSMFDFEFFKFTKLPWVSTYCAFGNSYQDAVQQMYSAKTPEGYTRLPMIALITGQWMVLAGTTEAFLVRNTLEAIALWLLLVWCRHDCKMEDGLPLDGLVQNFFELPVTRQRLANQTEIAGNDVKRTKIDQYLDDNCKKRWTKRFELAAVIDL